MDYKLVDHRAWCNLVDFGVVHSRIFPSSKVTGLRRRVRGRSLILFIYCHFGHCSAPPATPAARRRCPNGGTPSRCTSRVAALGVAAVALLARQHAPERAAIPSQSPGGPCRRDASASAAYCSAGGHLQTLHLSGALLAARVRNKACATCRRAQDCADTREERRRSARRRDHGSARRRPDERATAHRAVH